MQSELGYFDYASTTPVDQRVLETMIPYFSGEFGNPSSRTHEFGRVAEEAVKKGRAQVASIIGAKPEEIIFTSGSTEAINLALKGVFESYKDKGNHIITVSTEHKAVLDTCKYLETKGAQITYLPVDENGLLSLENLQGAITSETILVSVMFANNETGVIQDIEEIIRITKEAGALFMTDATQAVGKVPLKVHELGIDLLTCSAHKFYGPKGIGALYVKRKYPKIQLTPIIHGGGHEKGFRSGTLNAPLIVGLGKACELANNEMEDEGKRLGKFRDQLEQELLSIDGCVIHSSGVERLPNISNMHFKDIDGEALIMAIRDRIAISNGSACTSAEILPSHVLMAMFEDEDLAYSAIRISLGRQTMSEEIEIVIRVLKEAVSRLKSFTDQLI
ncbi:cysteine desulfurase family protein [Pontibacter sp. G13]|uniref:cysteine desulfurase family protein n=1 Tax=Pontibacter sp. G13 TaxID=3074898 RepID=UPI00288B380B|nr:cysteine desulfurase family protein [Pontibacter sp. G13]WNJ17165.1 cysteine desulfurase family protein [Pontibacter sp. G13]